MLLLDVKKEDKVQKQVGYTYNMTFTDQNVHFSADKNIAMR